MEIKKIDKNLCIYVFDKERVTPERKLFEQIISVVTSWHDFDCQILHQDWRKFDYLYCVRDDFVIYCNIMTENHLSDFYEFKISKTDKKPVAMIYLSMGYSVDLSEISEDYTNLCVDLLDFFTSQEETIICDDHFQQVIFNNLEGDYVNYPE